MFPLTSLNFNVMRDNAVLHSPNWGRCESQFFSEFLRERSEISRDFY